ncbi:hypothetical protein [Pseudoalteromonas rubra]|uniref:hypothetical protein n=1 Tax=Pseudoalteromonas rubra TaxID=43658 RepID=UPI002DBEE4A6|nr:hypothetical protein [Pseudoalteromonas rubra]MEC4087640.1 hypothetical protein [Pseudoalteromonas rubra]
MKTPNYTTLTLGALSLALSLPLLAATSDNANSGVGINLTGINYWSSQWTTLDVMKHASNGSGQLWATSNAHTWEYNTGHQALLDLDEQGWPRSLPGDSPDAPFHYVTTIIYHDNPHHPVGEFVILYEGEGELYYSGPELISSEPGRDVVRMSENSFFHLQIHATDPNNTGNHIRNIRIIAPGGSCSDAATDYAASAADCASPEQFASFEHSYQERIFHPLFLDDMHQFRTLRFMQLLSTIDNPVQHWAQRNQYDYASWALNGGSPYEVAIAMSNKLGAEPWYTLPVRVDDEYIRQFARLLKTQSEGNSSIYVEFGNELWNNAWPYIFDGLYLEEQGKALWPDTNYHDIEYRMNYYGLRSAQMCDIIKTEFAEDAGRIQCVMGGQTGVPWISEQALNCPIHAAGVGQRCADNMDVLAVGSYFAGYFADQKYLPILRDWASDGAEGLNNLFEEMDSGILHGLTYNPDEPPWWQAPEQGALAQARDNIQGNLALAQQDGLMLAAYEGGQHLTYAGDIRDGRDTISEALFLSANRDPRMASAFTNHLNDWQTSGAGLYVVFESIGRWDSWGAFPLKEYQTQTRAQAHKYDAVLSFIEQTPCWWAGCEQSAQSGDNADSLPAGEDSSQAAMLNLSSSALFDSNGVGLSWQFNPVAEIPVKFEVYRDAQLIWQTTANSYEDHWLQLNQPYQYQVRAVHRDTGTVMAEANLSSKAGDSEPPTAPAQFSVQSDGAYGATLQWQPSADNQGIRFYKIIRNGQPYTLSDTAHFDDPWPPKGEVSYQVIAIDLAGNQSDASPVGTLLIH